MPGISSIHVVQAGEGYARGLVRAVGDAGMRGAGLRALVNADPGGGVFAEGGGYFAGRITGGVVEEAGFGYLPDTRLEIYYGPRCAYNDSGCEGMRMWGSVTAVEQQWNSEAGIVVQRNCDLVCCSAVERC